MDGPALEVGERRPGALEAAHTLAKVRWFSFVRLVFGDFAQMTPPARGGVHKLAVLGDETAEGLGDYTVVGALTGVAGRLEPLLARLPRVRNRWVPLNRGYAGSTSADWLPDAPSPPPFSRVRRTVALPCGARGRNLMAHALACRGAASEADVVVLSAGRNDYAAARAAGRPDRPQETVDAIMAAADALAAPGRTVLVCTLPLPDRADADEYLPNRLRNELLRRELAAREAANASLRPEQGRVCAGPDLGGAAFLPDAVRLAGGRGDLNADGHRAFAAALAGLVEVHMIRHEFQRFMPALLGRKKER